MEFEQREMKLRAWLGNYGIDKLVSVTSIDWYGINNIKGEPSVICLHPYDIGAYKLSDTPIVEWVGYQYRCGKDIYEGDIFNLLDKNGEIISPKNIVKLADFLGGHYWIIQNGGTPIYEIIGNVFENPELWEGANE